MSFKKIDDIALGMGINEDDDRRVKALIIYVMKETCFNRGDTYLKLEDISFGISNYVSITSEKLDYLMVKLTRDKKIVIIEDRYYLKNFYEAEKYICERICFLNDMSVIGHTNINKYLDNEKFSNIVYE